LNAYGIKTRKKFSASMIAPLLAIYRLWFSVAGKIDDGHNQCKGGQYEDKR
jgi:hypothetical protein